MSTVTVVATVEASNLPPRIRLDVTDTGTSPAINSTTVTRLNPDGTTSPVRTSDGNPLQLTTSGSNRVGLLYDYEAPFGLPVTYSTLESPTQTSSQVTVNSSSVWLIHVGVPARSQAVELRAGSLDDETYSVQQGVFWPQGRSTPVVVTDGARRSMQSSLIVATDTSLQLAALRDLAADAGTLYLNIPGSLGYLVDSCYIAVSDVKISRLVSIGSVPQRNVTMPFMVVDRPAGGSQALRTYTDLLSFSNYTTLRAAYPTYAALLAGP